MTEFVKVLSLGAPAFVKRGIGLPQFLLAWFYFQDVHGFLVFPRVYNHFLISKVQSNELP